MLRRLLIVIPVVALIAFAFVVSNGAGGKPAPSGTSIAGQKEAEGDFEADSGEADGGEAGELRDTTRARLQALRVATRSGHAAVSDSGPGPRVTTTGWGDEQVFSQYDDWEPNVAADPSSGYVYMLSTQYGGPKACDTCPHAGVIVLRTSTDGGHNFGPQTYLCECPGHSWQADPIINIDAEGNVYAAWLTNPFGTVFSRSTDHGVTWTEPVAVAPNIAGWNDHPWMAVSPSGQDVYLGVNHRDNYQVSSHDFGQTWSDPVVTNPPGDYYFAVGAVVADNGDVVFSDAAFTCCGKGTSTGPVHVVIIRSTDGGATWTEQTIDTSAPMPWCFAAGCPHYQYGTEVSIGKDGNGDLMVAYTAARNDMRGERVYVSKSTDSGATWGPALRISPTLKTIATFPQIVGGQGNRFAVAWQDDRHGPDRFETWERETFDAGQTWTADAQISNLGHGAAYKHPSGYQFPYGDYFDIAINNQGETFAAWGEGTSYNGPGGIWYNAQTTGQDA